MDRAEFEAVREFAQSLSRKRAQVADGQLLDICQRHLTALLEHVADEFENHPHIDDAKPVAAKKRSHHKKVPH